MPNIGTSPDTHLLETLFYFAPNSCQVVYVELQSPLSPLASPHQPSMPPPPPPPLPPPPPPPPLLPLLLSCLAPLVHCYCRRCCFSCSLLIVVCPHHCHCHHLCCLCHHCCHRQLCSQHCHCRPPSDGGCHDCSCCVTAAVVFIVIVIVVPVAVINNNAMPSPRHNLCCRTLLSLLS
jgi:hypothetical protein